MSMEGPQKFTTEGLEGVRQVPREENLDRDGKIERAEMSVKAMFDKKMESKGTITSFEYPRK
jgi:hypothetical protein